MSSAFGKVSEGALAFEERLRDTARSLTSSYGSMDSEPSSGAMAFLQSNTMVAKFAFLILILFVFIFILRVGTSLLSWLFSPSSTPVLVKGMKDARQMVVIPQDPNQTNSIPILRSNNERDGIEFTYSVWLWINDLTYLDGQYRHVFHKGNDNINFGPDGNVGVNFPNNAPGLYIAPNKNALVVMMNSFNKINEEIIIPDIPVKKWVNVVIRCEGRNVDVYINGTLTRRHVLDSVPKQNYGDVYVSMNGGFDGYISQLQYFNYALGVSKLQSIIRDGPNMKMEQTDMTKAVPPYLSTRWYFTGTKDAYNP